jgi:hypothetical protein
MGGGAEPEVEAELRLQPVATDTDRYSLLLWKWYSQPGPELQAELSLGVLQLATQGKKRELLSLPLSAPQRQQANTLIAAIRDPLPLNPHLEKLVLSSEKTGKRYPGSPRKARQIRQTTSRQTKPNCVNFCWGKLNPSSVPKGNGQSTQCWLSTLQLE